MSNESTEFTCPIPATHDKYNEAHYFIGDMLREYHHPSPFRWNLNAFLQALRSVTFMLQKEMAAVDGFKEWYKSQRAVMKEDALLRQFDEGRDLVVHKGTLNARSTVEVGIFRGRTRAKLVWPTEEATPQRNSEELLRLGQQHFIGFLLDEEHSAIDEQIGVRRLWLVEELGDDEVVSLCDKAWSRIGRVVADAHPLVGAKFEHPPEDAHYDVAITRGHASVLLESDLDPDLPQKWGWI